MLNALAVFTGNINKSREQSALYDYLVSSIHTPWTFDDILRAQIVNSVSAFDKLIHDVIKVGMVSTFIGRRSATPKYRSEAISMELHKALIEADMPPAEVLYEQNVIRKLRTMTFQDPDKVSDGLSLIWDSGNKWKDIGAKIGVPGDEARKTLKLISSRRNSIVHEADTDPATGEKMSVSRDEANAITDFLYICGKSVVNLVL